MEAIWQFEILINIFFQHLGAWLLLPMKGVSFLGRPEFFLLVIPAFYWCVDSRNGLRLGMMLMATASVNMLLKLVFQYPRPYWIDRRVAALAVEVDYGMPSGHSQTAMAMWGYLSRLYTQVKWLFIAAIAIILLTGVSRVYLGVHFADQVLVGWLVGAVLIWVFARSEAGILRLVSKMPADRIILVIFVVSLGMIGLHYLLAGADTPVPAAWQENALAATSGMPIDPLDAKDIITVAGTFCGIASGAAWDWRKHGPLPTSGSNRLKMARYITGLTGLVVLYLGLKLILPGTSDFPEMALRYVQFTLIGLWVTLFAPSLFRRVRLV